MNTIKDFLSELKDRLTNPLISSFIVSWLLWNWPITVSFLFYSQEQLRLDQHNSYIDLILKHASSDNMLLYPLVCSIVYTLIFPLVKGAIIFFNAWVVSQTDTRILHSTKSTAIPIGRFLRLKEDNQNISNELNIIYKEEKKTGEENVRLKHQLVEKEEQLKQLNDQFHDLESKLNKLNDNSLLGRLDGRWEITIKSERSKIWEIDKHMIEELDSDTLLKIDNYVFDPLANNVSFTLLRLDAESKDWVYFKQLYLNANPELNRLTGKDDTREEITLVRLEKSILIPKLS